ncbi:general stress protein [Agromyces sp. NPDC060279]|uniref:general stress protein n=1 Tax=Agromyces sp. NPDC060279 TaxID=3347092 RepID=UPI00365CCD22
MSSSSPFGGRLAQAFPTLPKGETVASYETYAEAQAAVDRLAKAEFPVKELAIVGTDLTSVERITGKLTWGRVAGGGALSGAWFGLFLGLLFFIFAPSGPTLGILGAAVLIGAGFGMVFGLVSYSINRRRRDFTSVMQVLATRYAIIAEPQHVDRARNVLGVDAPAAAAQAGGWSTGWSSREDAARSGSSAAPVADASTAPDAPAAPAAPADGSGEEGRPLTYGEALDAERRAKAREAAARAAEQRAAAERAAREAAAAEASAPAETAAEPPSGDAERPRD